MAKREEKSPMDRILMIGNRLMEVSFVKGFSPWFLAGFPQKGKRAKWNRQNTFLLVTVLLAFFKGPAYALADSGNGLNQGNGTPFMPMMGTFGGASNKPFSPIHSGVLRYPTQGHQVAGSPSDCSRFHYSSNPPSSGLMVEAFITKNDMDENAVSPCVITNVIHRGNIILFYDPSRLTPQTVENIHGMASSDQPSEGFLQQQKLGYAFVLMKGHYKDPIVLLAWRRILPLSFLDQMKINMFVSRYRGQIARNK